MDGQPDLILQNAQSGQIAFWYLNRTNVLNGAFATTLLPQNWKVTGPR